MTAKKEKRPENSRPTVGEPKDSEPSGTGIDYSLLFAKSLVFLACFALGASVLRFLPDLNIRGWRVDFLLLALAVVGSLTFYFTAGLALLRLIIPNYSKRLRLGKKGHAFETPVLALVSDLVLHSAALLVYGQDWLSISLVIASALFFAYPFYYLVNTLWSLQPEVLKIVKGKQTLRTSYYANIPLATVEGCDDKGGNGGGLGANAYLPVTISLPVYTEANEVIFATIKKCLAALERYQKLSGKKANLLVSDDGLAKLLEAPVSERSITEALSGARTQAAERLDFYRRNNISFVARPLSGRAGKFRKSSNLNYSYELARYLSRGIAAHELFAADGMFAGGYAEGNITVHDIILLLDKDSGLEPDILAATLPEFSADPSLAFTQHTTQAQNATDNYFSWMMARFTDLVYRLTLPAKALQGLQVHLMGHNAFIRKAFLEQTHGWAEDRVSEDYAKALVAYSTGWHGCFIAYTGLDFSEHVCQSFSEEASKQFRYSYGISEIVPDRSLRLSATMRTDLILYYFSFINLIAALPMILVLLFFHQIYYLFAGVIVNVLIFLILPIVQGWIFGRAVGFSSALDAPRYFVLNALGYMGYSFSMLRGFLVFLGDKVRGSYKPFGSTSVDTLEPSFITGVRLLAAYLRDNKLALILYCCIILGCLSVLSDYPAHYIRPLLALFLILHVVSPIILTPQLFAPFALRARRQRKRREAHTATDAVIDANADAVVDASTQKR